MAFLDTVKTPENKTPSGGGFLDAVKMPSSQERANYIAKLQQDAAKQKVEAEKLSSFGGTLKGALSNLMNIPKDFFSTLGKTYGGGEEGIASKLAQDIKQGANTMEKESVLKGAAQAGFRTAGDVAITVFAPISAAIGAILNATGGQKLIDKAGEVVADKSGITDIPAFQKFAMEHPNAGADFERMLTLALAKGETGKIDPVRMAKEAEVVARKLTGTTPPPPKFIPVQSVGGENVITPNTPATRFMKYAKEQGYEGYTPAERLPVIEMGKTPKPAKETLPSIQMGEQTPTSLSETMNYEPITEPLTQPGFISSVVETPKPEMIPTPMKQPTGEVKTTGLASSLADDTIAKGIKAEFGDLPEYRVMNMADQARKARALIDSDPTLARNIIENKAYPPGDLRAGSVYVAMKLKAIAEGDVTSILNLSKAKINEVASAYGQEIKSLDSGIPNDPVRAIKNVYESRVNAFTRRSGGDVAKTIDSTVKQIRSEIAKVAPTKTAWSEFVDSITC